jgi:hypothetical protein
LYLDRRPARGMTKRKRRGCRITSLVARAFAARRGALIHAPNSVCREPEWILWQTSKTLAALVEIGQASSKPDNV